MRYHGGGFRGQFEKGQFYSRFFLIEASGHVMIKVIESRVVFTESVLEVWDR